jgi:hypothetical protein
MERYEAELALPPLKDDKGGTRKLFANRLYHPVKVQRACTHTLCVLRTYVYPVSM